MQQETAWTSETPFLIRLIGRNIPTASFLLLAMVGMLFVYWFFSPATDTTAQAIAIGGTHELSAPIYKAIPSQPIVQRLAQSPGPIRVGIISGHKGSDSGAVCDDGLTEAAVTANIAEKVAAQLQSQGIQTDILEEFDSRLSSYEATAVVSIHADSCGYFNDQATGYKIAGSSRTDSITLFNCMAQQYQAATQLPFHANTITEHMTDYHVFRELPPGVPAIILEVGFLNLDRQLLTANADIPIQGVTSGITCYLDTLR